MLIVDRIDQQAVRWAVRADSGLLEPDEQQELDAWLNADPRHLGAYVRARARWVDLDRLAALQGPSRPMVPEIDSHQRISRRGLLAAGIAAVTVIGGGFSWLVLRKTPQRYASGVGEVRRIALEDGSTLLLNTASEVTAEFRKRRRDFHLVRGEALFEVAHDKTRPFVVLVNDTAVRAVGTAFAVRLEATQVDVTVTEGVVELGNAMATLSADDPPSEAPEFKVTRVSATERAVISGSRAPEVSPIAPAVIERLLAWRDGFVSFDGESLQAAVAEINRHNRRKIVIEDQTLAAKPVVGIFRATDLEGFSEAAAAALKARAVPDGEIIRLEPPGAKRQD
jgi:transmembrane sensor